MAQPTFRRYWVKVVDNKNYPQFDEDGTEHAWREYDVKPTKVLFLPFTKEHADNVRKKGTLVDIKELPPIEIDVKNDVKWCRPSKIIHVPFGLCGFCGAVLPPVIWKWGRDDKGIVRITEASECPRCFSSNHWYCDKCDKFYETMLLDDRDNIFCPKCEERGMMKVYQICECWDEVHSHVNVLDVDGKRRIILDFMRK